MAKKKLISDFKGQFINLYPLLSSSEAQKIKGAYHIYNDEFIGLIVKTRNDTFEIRLPDFDYGIDKKLEKKILSDTSIIKKNYEDFK